MDGQSKRHNGRVDPSIGGLCHSDFNNVGRSSKADAIRDFAILAFGLIVLGLMTIFDKFEER